MNDAKAIELALATVIRQFAAVGPGVAIRPWQSLRFDTFWKKEKDRHFPMIDIRCGAATVAEDQSSMVSAATVQMGTEANADQDHAFVSQMYTETMKVLRAVWKQFMQQAPGPEYNLFRDTLTQNAPPDFSFGGVSFGEPRDPYDDGGYNFLTIGFNVHHSWLND